MSEAVSRAVAAATATTASRERVGPFVSTQWALTEIAIALSAGERRVLAIQDARIDKSLSRMIEEQKALAKLLSQATQLSDTVAHVLAAHQKDPGNERTS